MKDLHIALGENSRAEFHNHTMFCVGTGRMSLALHSEYMEQLKNVQAVAPFSHIRGHGLFCDDMGIYQPYTDENGVEHEHYNFVYLDRVVDEYLRAGIKPFLELGFMPEKMASGTQTIFYWEGNVTPPADENKWAAMVRATLAHLAERYGEDEVSAWPCEVWNEPNLQAFWENADKEKYLRLYAVTVKAVKEVLPRMRVGGPAICGGEGSQQWIDDFLRFCRDEKLPVDFVTRHTYMGMTTTKKGRFTYHEMRTVESIYEEMKESRRIIDSYPEYRGLEMHITEFNTSYNPLCPIHDTNLNAAYIAGLLACLGDVATSYSYWTFGDVFEECGVPPRPFHGGFGMMAAGSIPKPTLWTFAFFSRLKGTPVYRDDHAVLVRNADGSYEGVLFNICREDQRDLAVSLSLPGDGAYTLMTSVVDEACCNPLRVWHEMGEPASLSKAQADFLRTCAQPRNDAAMVAQGETVKITLGKNAVTYVKLSPLRKTEEYGYDYEWYRVHY